LSASRVFHLSPRACILLWDDLSELYHTGHATPSFASIFMRSIELRADRTPEIDADTRARPDIGDYFWDVDNVAPTSWTHGTRTGGT
jgi:hypothetical protein